MRSYECGLKPYLRDNHGKLLPGVDPIESL